MPMPRPRILGSPRYKHRNTDNQTNPQSPVVQLPRQTQDEPDCEIIKIEDEEQEKKPSKVSNGSMTIEVSREQSMHRMNTVQFVKQCPMRLQEQFNDSPLQSIVAPISPSLALQFVPDTSLGGETRARNVYSSQSVVMVLPVNTVSSQVFNTPTLCTLEKIDNPNEISRIKQVVATQKGNHGALSIPPLARAPIVRRDPNKQFIDMHKKILQKIFMNNSTVNETTESNARSLIPWKKRERTADTRFLGNQTSSIPVSAEPTRNVPSFNSVKTLNSTSRGSNVTVSSMDIQECFSSVSNTSVNTYCLVSHTGSNPLSRENTNNICYLDNPERAITQSDAPSNRFDSLDIQECSVSVSNNPKDNCSAEDQTSSNCRSLESTNRTSSVEKQNGSYSQSKESTNTINSSGSNKLVLTKRPVPPLTKISDNSTSFEEQKVSISVSPEPPDNVHSLGNKERSISPVNELTFNETHLETKKYSISSSRSKESFDSDNSLNSRKNFSPSSQMIVESVSQNDEPSSKPDQRKESFAEEDSPVTKLVETSSCESIGTHSWKAQCIACKEKFFDRTELHRHATLSHPGVQIVFCHLCSESFLTERELKEHRSVYCQGISSYDQEFETFVIDDENDLLSSNAKSRKALHDKQVSSKRRKASKQYRVSSEPLPGHSRSQKERSRGRLPHKKVGNSSAKSKNRPKSSPSSSNSSRVEKRKPQTKNKTVIVKYSYVEEDVIRHSATAAKSKFKSAEIKKLIVPLTRLEGPVLEKYLEKLANMPVTTFGGKKVMKRRNFRRNKGTPKISPSCAKNIDNLRGNRRGKRKRWPSTKLRREEYAKVRKSRQVAMSRIDAINHDSDTDEIMSINSSHSALRILSISNQFQASDEDTNGNDKNNKKSACIDLTKRRSHSDSEEALSDISMPEYGYITYDGEMDEETMRRFKSRKKESKELNGKHAESSDEIDVMEIDSSDSSMKNRTVIRKLTSRSSAASVVAMEINRKMHDSQNVRRKSNGREKKSRKEIRVSPSSDRNSRLLLRGDPLRQSDASVCEVLFARGLGQTDSDEATKKNDKDIADEGNKSLRQKTFNDSEKSKTPTASQNFSRKTYLPSKRYSAVATKLRKQSSDLKTNAAKCKDLCFMCKELLTTMKQVTTEFEGNMAKKISVQCPFCDLHFISMFYLEEHVAGNHLHCKSEPPCRQSKSFAYGDAELDCETKVELSLDCSQCTTKFTNKEDLNDHIITDHDKLTPLKEISSTSTPDYLKDLSSFCFQTVQETEKESSKSARSHRCGDEHFASPTNIKRIFDTSCSSNEASKINNSWNENPSTSECWLCDSKFKKHLEYVSHMRDVHDTLIPVIGDKKAARSLKNNWTVSSNSESFLFEIESSGNEEVAPKLNPREQIKADRDYLLKQLLSDDSMDGFEEIEDSQMDNTAKEVTVKLRDENVDGSTRKKVIGLLAKAHTCKVCSKEFNRAQDLLIHGLSHGNDPTESEANFSKSTGIESQRVSQELFVDLSTNDDTMNIETFVSANETKRDNNESRNKAANEDFPTTDNIFASNSDGEESDNLAVIQGSNGARERVTIGSNRKASKSKEMPKKSANKNSSNSKKSRSEKTAVAVPETPQLRNEKRDALKELLDTEKALANADGTILNDKVPIECSKCNRKFPNQSLLNRHLFFLHDDSLKDTVLTDVLKTEEKSNHRWHCKSCRQDFKLLQGYSRHRYLMHGDESMVHVCENCCKILTTVTMVNVHICTDVASYNCRTCEETFSTGMSLRLHNSEKHMETDEPNICEPCNKKFLTKAMLNRHEKSRHRFLRPYRPRKRSPVIMATHDSVVKTDEELSDRTKLDGSDEYALQSDSDEDEGMDFESEARESPGISNRRKVSMSSKLTEPTRRRGRSRKKISNENYNLPDETNIRGFGRRAFVKRSKNTTKYIDENEIYQCSLCQLYCLTKIALENHKAKIHLRITKVCQLCRKMYADGKVIRHMIDEHINPCETYAEINDSIWNIKKNIEERDTEAFVRTLGLKRLMSLWEYQTYTESTIDCAINCPTCDMNFPSNSMYRFHFFTHHDTMCALCNIEFKTGEDAAKHKKEEHRSASCYLWFVDRTMKELTAVKNFREVVERSFIEMISRDCTESYESTGTFFDDIPSETEEPTFTGEYTETVEVENTEETNLDENVTLSEDLEEKQEKEEEEDDQKLIVVVTDKDLEKYDIGTDFPNIWGLASQISSTCEGLTPKDVKEMLESYFEN